MKRIAFTAWSILVALMIALFAINQLNTSPAEASCGADKIGTWSELSNNATHRIEVGGNGDQHADLYPAKGVKAVSFVVMPMEPVIYNGMGSIWEWPHDCGVNVVDDAIAYASGRMNNGHSGIVADLWVSTGELIVYGNVGNLCDQKINDLLMLHMKAMNLTLKITFAISVPSCGAPVTAPTPIPSATPSPSNGCEPATPNRRDPVVGQTFRFNDSHGWVIVNGWTNEPNQDQGEFTFLLGPTDNPELLIGGSYYFRPDNCHESAENEISKSPLTKAGKRVDLNYLRGRGLVR